MVSLRLIQPDVGQAVLLTAIWGTQLFLAGLPLAWIAGLAVVGAGGLVAAYFALPHVTARVDSFFDPTAGDRYQLNRSLEEIGRTHVWNPVTNAHLVCRLLI